MQLTKIEQSLQTIDNFESSIRMLDELKKKYEDIKSDIKKQMLDIANQNGLEKVKWTTPKGIQITLSVGKKAQFEEVEELRFDEFKLANEYPEIYEKCKVMKKRQARVQDASNDTLRITLPKKEGNEDV